MGCEPTGTAPHMELLHTRARSEGDGFCLGPFHHPTSCFLNNPASKQTNGGKGPTAQSEFVLLEIHFESDVYFILLFSFKVMDPNYSVSLNGV